MACGRRLYQVLTCRRLSKRSQRKVCSLLSISICFLLFYYASYSIHTLNIDSEYAELQGSSIGIFVVSDEKLESELEQHIASLACYAYRHSYHFILMHPQQYTTCTESSYSIYFQKHCLVLMYLRENVHVKWLMVLDLDVLVLNISKTIESFLPSTSSESDIHVILYERFNGEIAAGNYLVHNHPWAHSFLAGWIAYESQTSKVPFHNNDNGALHLHMLGAMIGNVSRHVYDYCFDIFKTANGSLAYHRFVGCCKCALDGRWHFKHVRILRRGHSFVRDNLGFTLKKRIFPSTDFLLHGQRQNTHYYYSDTIDTYKCASPDWKLPIDEDAVATNYSYVKWLVGRFDIEAASAYPESVGIPEISNCWPHCVDSEIRRRGYLRAVCKKHFAFRTSADLLPTNLLKM